MFIITIKEFAETADITCDEANEILEGVFDIIPLTNNYVLPDEVSEKIQKEFAGNKKHIEEVLEALRNEQYTPETTGTTNEGIIKGLLDKDFTIFVDTNIIYNKGFESFVSSIEDVLKTRNAKLRVLSDVEKEIKKHAGNKKSKINALAKKSLAILNKYIKDGIFKIEKESDIKKICKDNFADFTFQIVFQVYRSNNKNVMLVTNDRNLTVDTLMLNHVSSVDSKAEMRVGRISDDGVLVMQKLASKK